MFAQDLRASGLGWVGQVVFAINQSLSIETLELIRCGYQKRLDPKETLAEVIEVCTGKLSASLGRDLQGSKILAGRGQAADNLPVHPDRSARASPG